MEKQNAVNKRLLKTLKRLQLLPKLLHLKFTKSLFF